VVAGWGGVCQTIRQIKQKSLRWASVRSVAGGGVVVVAGISWSASHMVEPSSSATRKRKLSSTDDALRTKADENIDGAIAQRITDSLLMMSNQLSDMERSLFEVRRLFDQPAYYAHPFKSICHILLLARCC
jgi:hypothetical protein